MTLRSSGLRLSAEISESTARASPIFPRVIAVIRLTCGEPQWSFSNIHQSVMISSMRCPSSHASEPRPPAIWPTADDILTIVMGLTSPERATRMAVARAGLSAQDTVPFALWCAARHLDDYAEALRLTVSGLGDRDTTCAIVGGIVACFTGEEGIPSS
jgi:hypothetical protein